MDEITFVWKVIITVWLIALTLLASEAKWENGKQQETIGKVLDVLQEQTEQITMLIEEVNK